MHCECERVNVCVGDREKERSRMKETDKKRENEEDAQKMNEKPAGLLSYA